MRRSLHFIHKRSGWPLDDKQRFVDALYRGHDGKIIATEDFAYAHGVLIDSLVMRRIQTLGMPVWDMLARCKLIGDDSLGFLYGGDVFHQGRVLFQQFLTASASTRKAASIDLQRFLQRYYPMYSLGEIMKG